MLNKVILMGRLTKEPELRHTQADVPVASFTLAVDRGYKKDSDAVNTDFINIVAWRSTAEFVSKWFAKGQLVAVSGRLQARTYKDRDGNNKTTTEVVADEAFFAENKRKGAEGTSYIAETETPENEPNISLFDDGNFEEIVGSDGDLPF